MITWAGNAVGIMEEGVCVGGVEFLYRTFGWDKTYTDQTYLPISYIDKLYLL
jgi:hypothetical protein